MGCFRREWSLAGTQTEGINPPPSLLLALVQTCTHLTSQSQSLCFVLLCCFVSRVFWGETVQGGCYCHC
jgi:hypothetical protein